VTAAEQREVAGWFAHEIAGNESRWSGDPLPESFMQLVAREMVDSSALGWPTTDEARAFLFELGWG
jgi:hypothetical protein